MGLLYRLYVLIGYISVAAIVGGVTGYVVCFDWVYFSCCYSDRSYWIGLIGYISVAAIVGIVID